MAKWIDAQKRPPIKKRLFLIVSVATAGGTADANLIGKSEVTVGYWTGNQYFPLIIDTNDLGTKLQPQFWALAEPLLPDGIELRHLRILDDDVRG